MEREYFVRGERRTVEQVEDVGVVKAAPDARARLDDAAASAGTATAARDAGLSAETADAFRQAGWLLVEPSPAEDGLRAREESDDVERAGALVRRPNGRFGIVTRRLTLQLDPGLAPEEAEATLAELGLSHLLTLNFAPNLYEVDTVAHADAIEAAAVLDGDARVVFAEPSLVEHVGQRFTPTDPRYTEQWQWSNTGQNGGTVGADVSVETAWDTTRGAGVTVAVIDNGFNAEHEDLREGVLATSGFFRTNGSGAPEFVQGTAGMPGSNHGTFCAGMVGARQGNGVGVSGAAPESDLMLLAALGDQVGTQVTLARAVGYAADPSTLVPGADPASGADVLVSSLGPNGADWDLTEVLRLSLESAATNGRQGRGLAIFWAASNGDNVDVLQDEVVSHPDVIAVVRSDRDDHEDNAARGPEVELIAPGVDVVSTTSSGYGASTGTSFAAPCAAGVAALALAVDPELSRDQLRAVMHDSADKVGGVAYDANGHNDDYGFGRVNAARAVELAAGGHPAAVGGVNAVALVRQTPGWGSIPVAASNGDGTWTVTNGAAGPDFIPTWANQPGVRVVTGDFNGNGFTDVALVRQTPGWGSIPVAFANGDGTWAVTNGAAGPDFIPTWANQPGVRVVTGDFNGNGLTDIALVRQTPGWGSIPVAFANGDGTWTVTNGPAGPDFIPTWANQPGVRVVTGDFNGNGLTDIALVRQTPGWGSIPIAFANGDGTWTVTNGAAGPDFIPSWANQPGVKLVTGDFNGNGLTDIALVRQTPGWGSIPVAFANGDGTWTVTNGAAGPDFIPSWANQPGVKLVTGDFNGNGLTDIALVRQTPGWGSIPIAFANGDGTWTVTNGPAAPDFIPTWANQPGVKLVTGDFNGNGLTDIALVRQTPGWGSIPIAFANGDGTWTVTNGAAGPDFIPTWANQPGVRLVPGTLR
ncbi:S8 family serine peptidase [Cellulomonas cellasea]|uniref:Subtilisin family serine protease n=1 Tax=Cellulomonas cellasea TaxID=43670 RepID=A0A7W4YCY7_9CELL|nr:S8 family serine peptidase [Cellulomonas cellasea]MBB2924639.1 subtilisin family serine protease [Cellulomonas cellasea]